MTLRERINAADFESERFGVNLIERIEWAVSDAAELERPERTTERVTAPRSESEPEPDQTPQPDPERPREPAWA